MQAPTILTEAGIPVSLFGKSGGYCGNEKGEKRLLRGHRRSAGSDIGRNTAYAKRFYLYQCTGD